LSRFRGPSICDRLPWLRPLGSISAPYRTSPRLAVDHLSS
jgi:hypothetical protein